MLARIANHKGSAMRILTPLLAATLLALPALAQTAAAAPKHTRLTMTQRFEQANTTHDGHLTLEQAKAGYKSVARHFAEIDADKKGYVTEDDIRAYNKAHHAGRHQSAATHHQPSS
jgi:hypothetical protein